jgi:hypothetical protein
VCNVTAGIYSKRRFSWLFLPGEILIYLKYAHSFQTSIARVVPTHVNLLLSSNVIQTFTATREPEHARPSRNYSLNVQSRAGKQRELVMVYILISISVGMLTQRSEEAMTV